MGTDQTARALGAGDSIDVNGDTYHLSPLNMRQLKELQREALKSYKRQYLETFKDNMDLLGNGDGHALLMQKMEEIAGLDIGDLPKQSVYDVKRVRLTDELKALMVEHGGELPEDENRQLMLLSTLLDAGHISPNKVKELTGTTPLKINSPYDAWWVTGTHDGILSLIWHSVHEHHPDVTKDDFASWPFSKISEAARIAEKLTAPELGNM